MRSEAQPVRRDDLDRAIEALEGCEAPDALAALAYDVLGSQAEGRTIFAGKKLVEKRAQDHGVERDAAETSAGNLLDILGRGPKTPLDRALVAAFAVAGLDRALAADEEPRRRVFRFVRHADWLEVSSDFAVYGLVDRVLDEAHAEVVWAELAQRVVDEAAGRDGERPEVRARNAARLSSLAEASSEAAKNALREVVKTAAMDEPTRTLASTLAGDGSDPSPALVPTVTGRLVRTPRTRALEILRWITGWAILGWFVRGLAFLVGMRSVAELRIADGGLEVKTHLSILGRTVREREETWRLDALESAGRCVRYPAIHLVTGAVTLSLGVLLGGLFLFDGVRSGELILILLAAALLLGGAVLDLALDLLWPARKGHVAMDIVTRSRRPIRLASVPLDQADAFLRALRRAVARR